jgi:hypothetical protein
VSVWRPLERGGRDAGVGWSFGRRPHGPPSLTLWRVLPSPVEPTSLYRDASPTEAMGHVLPHVCQFETNISRRLAITLEIIGAPEEIRTPDLQIRSLVLRAVKGW